jgi:hypothetical protein
MQYLDSMVLKKAKVNTMLSGNAVKAMFTLGILFSPLDELLFLIILLPLIKKSYRYLTNLREEHRIEK